MDTLAHLKNTTNAKTKSCTNCTKILVLMKKTPLLNKNKIYVKNYNTVLKV